jgi:hypothetical protein
MQRRQHGALVAVVVFMFFTSCAAAVNLGKGEYPGNPCLTLEAFRNTNNKYLQQHAVDFASVSRFIEDTLQRVGIHNGCCTGLVQLNQSNLRNPSFCGCTPAEYGAYTQEQQIDVYANYFRIFDRDYGMTQLRNMIDDNQTLGGHTIDGYTLVACAQMGSGNCKAAVQNACSSVAVGQGGDNSVNVCTMADFVRAQAQSAPQVLGSCP